MPENPDNFCPHCLCPACVAHSRLLWEIQQQKLAEEAERARRRQEYEEREAFRQYELMQQGAMIWMLTNLVTNSTEAHQLMNMIGSWLDTAPSVINARRVIYVQELNKRAGIFSPLGEYQWKPPGTRGMDEPDWCSECGGIMTRGRRCKRSTCR